MYLIPSIRFSRLAIGAGGGLGDDAAAQPFGLDYVGRATYLAWTRDVASRGGLAVKLPNQAGKYAALLGERYPAAVIIARQYRAPLVWTTGQQFGYYLAPVKVLALDALHQSQLQLAIAEGKAAETLENVSKTLLGGLTGILTVAAIAGGAFFVLTHHRSS